MESLRARRVQSLGLHLTYHRDRPDDQDGGLSAFRERGQRPVREQDRFEPHSPRCRMRGVAYQLRECQTLALTSLWSWYLQELQETYPTTHAELSGAIVAAAEWSAAGLDGATSLTDARTLAVELLPDARAIVEAVAPFTQTPGVASRALARTQPRRAAGD